MEEKTNNSGTTSLNLTVIKTANGSPARKRVKFHIGHVETLSGYGKTKAWTRERHEIRPEIDAFFEFLQTLTTRADACLVTGAPCGPTPLDTPARRLKHEKPGDQPTLAETSAAWLPIDADKIRIPTPLDPLDPEPAIAHLVELLGAPFAETSYVWQLTSSNAPGADTISARLFFIIDREIDNAARKAWANGIKDSHGVKLIDPALYSAAQPIYTAAPDVDGHDPFQRRLGIVYGEHEAVPWDAVPIHPPESLTVRGRRYSGPVDRSIRVLLDAIGDHPGGEGCHTVILAAVWEMVRHKWTAERIIETIQAQAAAAYWDIKKHSPAYITQETSETYLKASINGAIAAQKRAENPPRATQTRPLLAEDTVSLDEATRRVKQTAESWIKGTSPARVVLSVTVGAGKTFQTAEAVRQCLREGSRILWAFPTHNQGSEVLEHLNTNRPGFSRRMLSRTREDEGREALCRRPELIKAIDGAGLSSQTARIACKNGAAECPFYKGCGYFSQFEQGESVRMIPHATLTKTKSRALTSSFLGECAGLVIDESPVETLLGHKSYTAAEVMDHGGAIADVLAMVQAQKTPESLSPDEREALKAALTDQAAELCKADLPVSTPAEPDTALLMAELQKHATKKSPNLWPLFRAAGQWLDGAFNLLWTSKADSGAALIFCAWLQPLPDIERILILDATPNEAAYRAILGDDVHFVRIDVQQKLEIIQAIDSPLGKRTLANPENDDLLAQVACLARMTDAAFISNKAAVELALAKNYLPPNYPTGHFNALRGINSLETCDALVIAGRPEPSALDIEAKARAIFSREALNMTGAYVWRTDGLASVASHTDAHCDAILRQYREAEIEQAIGRARGARAKRLKRIYLLTHTPIALPSVRHMPLEEILPEPKLARLLMKGDGVAIFRPDFMCQMLPEIWETPKAAKRWVENLKAPFCLCNSLIKGFGAFKYRVIGQKKPSRCFSWHITEKTRELLAVHLGQIVECKKISETEPRAQDQQPAPKLAPFRWTKPEFQIRPREQASPAILDKVRALFELPPGPLIDPISQPHSMPTQKTAEELRC